MAYNVRWYWDHPMSAIVAAYKRAETAGDVLWRFTDQQYAYSDPWEDDSWSFTGPILALEAFAVKRWTPCGATLYVKSGARNRFVNLQARKTFACKTIGEALTSYMARKERQRAIYQGRADKAKKAHDLAIKPKELYYGR